jgi:hypothetical protein
MMAKSTSAKPGYILLVVLVSLVFAIPDVRSPALDDSVALNPELADAHYNLGVLYRETGRTDEAEMAFLDAL